MTDRSTAWPLSLPALCGSSLLALAMASPAVAQTSQWTGAIGDNWRQPLNWTAAPSSPNSNVVIANGFGDSPRLDGTGAPVVVNNLFVGFDRSVAAPQLTLSAGASLTATNASIGEQSINNLNDTLAGQGGSVVLVGGSQLTADYLNIGTFGHGSVTVADGSSVTANLSLHLGMQRNTTTGSISDGRLVVTGSGSNVNANNAFLIGRSGVGVVAVLDGGATSVKATTLGYDAGASGTVTVSGPLSRWTNTQNTTEIGKGGTGVFTVEGGATASMVGRINLAVDSGSSGDLIVRGANTSMTATEVWTGVRATGTVSVTQGASLSASHFLLGTNSSGDGRLIIDGTGTTVGASVYTLIGWQGVGTATISNGATLNTAAVRLAYSAGSQGTLNIGAAMGAPAVAPGIVNATSIVFHDGTGTMVFNHTAPDFTLASTISGLGTIHQVAGTTILTGNGAAFTGTTTVHGGSLIVGTAAGGSLGGNVSVLGGATLGGSGTIGGNVTVASTGRIAPGNSVGTLRVGGNVSFATDSLYRAEIAGPSADLLSVGGTASLAGTMQIVAGGGTYRFDTPYTVLRADGGRAGTFGQVTTEGSFGVGVTSAVAYGAKTVDVTLKAAPLVPIIVPEQPVTPQPGQPTQPAQQLPAASLNGVSVAAAMDRALAAGADLSSFFPIYNSKDPQALANALSTLTGEVHGNAGALGNVAANGFLQATLDPTATGRDPMSMPGPAAVAFSSSHAATELPAGKGPLAAARVMPDRLYNAWGAIHGSKSRVDGDARIGSHRSEGSSGHVSLGIDMRVLPDTIVGIGVSAGEARSNLSNQLGSAKAQVLQAGLYGMTRIGDLSLGASVGYASADTETQRAIPALGAFGIKAKYRSDIFNGRLEAAYKLTSFGGIAVSPYAAVLGQHQRTPAFTEYDSATGAAAGVSMRSRAGTTARSELGLRLDSTMTLFGLSTTAFAKLGWGYYFQRDGRFTAALVGLPGSDFVMESAKPDRNAALVSTGLEIKLSDSVTLGGRFDGEFSEKARNFGGSASLRISF
ncbi:autotransporter domain-containing protein [Bosea sp. TWI1241]|uniref:autotransporter outer membrane beta-barrel domain-containing protein n=1 Tax=Bosea sp. TWI1241 TaxID=3148904 RepID=UPI003208E04E